MIPTRAACQSLVLAALVSLPAWTQADDWMSPITVSVPSSNGQHRVIVVPRQPGEVVRSPADKPSASVERLAATGKWQVLRQHSLVNEVAPVSVLLADDASFLVTFDNW